MLFCFYVNTEDIPNNLFLNCVFWATVTCASSIIISSITSIDVILNFHKTEGFLKEYQYRTKMPQPIVFILPCHLNTDPLVCTKGSVQCFIRRRCKASFRGWVLLICDPPINPRSTPWKFYRARSNLFQSLYHKMHSAKKTKKLRLQYSFKNYHILFLQ